MRSIKLAVLLSLAFLLVGAALRSHVPNATIAKLSTTSWLVADGVHPVPNPWLVADGVHPVPNPWLVADGVHPVPNPWLVS
jgi:hypothetical protein